MSAVNAADASSKSASKKKKKNKRKSVANNNNAASTTNHENGTNGVKSEPVADDDEEEEDDAASPTKSSIPSQIQTEDTLHMPSSPPEPASPAEQELPIRNGAPPPGDDPGDDEPDAEPDTRVEEEQQISAASDTSARFDAIQQERETLRNEVTALRKQLEGIQQRHTEELSGVKEELQKSESTKDHAESQYRTLLGKVNQIRSQLGERLKADAAELGEAKAELESLKDNNATAREENERLQESVAKLNSQLESQSAEAESLRNRTNLSTSNWAKERDDLASREAYLREEYEVAKQAMQDWEMLATEERSRREALEEQMQNLEEQLGGQREAFDRARGEAYTQSSTVDQLQRALRDLQDERKRELRELVEQTQTQLDALRDQATAAETTTKEIQARLETTEAELSRAAPFEKEVKEKNLLIGKLRHEAVILNDHLTKALRFLKRGKPEDNVDRQLVTNHLLHFVQLDRSDPKKFQVLQLIAALLGWDEQQKESAGLLRQGSNFSATAGGSLRIPMSPFRRTPSTPSLDGHFVPESPGASGAYGVGGKETLAELWSDFLEREAESGSQAGSTTGGSRRGSLAKSKSPHGLGLVTSPTSERGGMQLPAVGEKE